MKKKKQIVKMDFEQVKKACIHHVTRENQCFLLDPGGVLIPDRQDKSVFCSPKHCPMVEK